jgi:hypothetical protein
MTQDEIIETARQAGFKQPEGETWYEAFPQCIEAFAKLVAAKAIAELESQEPVGWHLIEALYPQGERLDIRMGDGSILCNLLPQADGDLWWDGSGTGEKFIDPVYADVTHWRIHSNTHPPQRTWVGLTDEEVAKCYADSAEKYNNNFSKEFYKNIEAKLKEKNT